MACRPDIWEIKDAELHDRLAQDGDKTNFTLDVLIGAVREFGRLEYFYYLCLLQGKEIYGKSNTSNNHFDSYPYGHIIMLYDYVGYRGGIK